MKKYCKKFTEHCCIFMHKFVNDSRVGVYYNQVFRDYTVFIPSSGSLQGIYNCPWCGSKLPYCLDDKYCEVLKKEYNIDDPYDTEQEKLIPEEFKSDEWWKKRNF